jgi:uncharacterized protein YodC (DUF2158 family)
MTTEYKIGDVVRLKSGGPAMTITMVGDNYGTPTVWCQWFDHKHTLQNGDFPPDAVEKDD